MASITQTPRPAVVATTTPPISYEEFTGSLAHATRDASGKKTILCAGYILVQENNNPWICCHIDHRCIDIYKIHASIVRKDMNKAFAYLFPLMKEYGIKYFKILQHTSLETARFNTLGKEVVFYIPPQADLQKWRLFLEKLRDGFLEIEVRPSCSSLGDVPIKGSCGFFYTRSVLTVVDSYVPAERLNGFGFARREGSRLSDSFHLSLTLSGGFEVSLSLADPGSYLPCPPALPVFTSGEETPNDVLTQFAYDCRALDDLMNEHPFSPQHSVYWTAYRSMLNDSSFATMVTAASTQVFQLRATLKCKETLGCIVPAIYHTFLRPFIEEIKKKGMAQSPLPSETFVKQGMEMLATFIHTHKDAIIHAITLCAFRSRGDQQDHLEPTYHTDPALIEVALKRPASSKTSEERRLPSSPAVAVYRPPQVVRATDPTLIEAALTRPTSSSINEERLPSTSAVAVYRPPQVVRPAVQQEAKEKKE